MKLRTALLVAIASVSILGLSSCVRDYVCQCEITYSGKPGLPDTLITSYKLTDTKKNAETLCQENSTESEEDGIKTVEVCDLY